MKRARRIILPALLSGLCCGTLWPEDKVDKSPSMDKVRWTGANVSSDLNAEYDFV